MKTIDYLETTGIIGAMILMLHFGALANFKFEACYWRTKNKHYMQIVKGKKLAKSKSKFIKGVRVEKAEQRQTYRPAPFAITLF